MAKLREIESYVQRTGFTPILAYDFDVPEDKIHDFDLRLLHLCKYAIFEEIDPAGELMELVRAAKEYDTFLIIIHEVRDSKKKEPPPRFYPHIHITLVTNNEAIQRMIKIVIR